MKDLKRLFEDHRDHPQNNAHRHDVGTMIRNARLARQLTQSDVAHGVCSVSYLSKIENGLYPSDHYFVKEIMRQMDLTYDKKPALTQGVLVQETLRALFLKDVSLLFHLREQFTEPTVPSAWLVVFAIGVLSQEDTEPAVRFLEQNRRVLSKEELHLFVLLFVMEELQHFRTQTVVRMIELLPMLNNEKPYYAFLGYWLRARYHVLVGEYAAAMGCLQQIIQHHGFIMTDTWRADIHYHGMLVLAFSGEMKQSTEWMEETQTLASASSWASYAKAYHFIQQQDYDQAMKEFLKAKDIHLGPSLLGIVETCFRAGQREKMHDYYNILTETLPGSLFEAIAYVFVLATQPELLPLKDHITHSLQPLFQRFGFYYYKQITMEYLREYYRGISRYKQVDLLRP